MMIDPSLREKVHRRKMRAHRGGQRHHSCHAMTGLERIVDDWQGMKSLTSTTKPRAVLDPVLVHPGLCMHDACRDRPGDQVVAGHDGTPT
ncbi:hypothetical protein VFPFJ_07834 [Purpureocillium lilacinum]|uniref:Uncharacterized protein n=1 Tax=Purpureocillium lilacinum TaxID=33203 RepID=A0A179H5I5_PURLI|nr:hypothetical protein VFPFJ_07834 [Purpureocillium lilacinum]OAQ85445.1 hypothetical protein VFPFJ_07834 [Purpureocillium lilacinum]